MGVCDSIIAKAIQANCENPIVKGLESTGAIINRDDIDFASCTVDGNKVTALVLKSGKKAYQVAQEGSTPFTGAKTEMAVGTYRNTFTNEIPIAILDNGPEVAADIIDALANGTFVLILRNKHRGSDGLSKYQIYGYYQGLRASAIANEKYSEDLEGGWLATLQEVGAPKSAIFLAASTEAATDTAYEALFATT